MSELRCQVEHLDSDQLRLDWLREQIETRVIGLGWVEFRSQWSSGKEEAVGTITNLTRHLSEILEAEQERVLPEAAAAPIMQRKTFKELGTPTAQAETLADQRLSLTSQERSSHPSLHLP